MAKSMKYVYYEILRTLPKLAFYFHKRPHEKPVEINAKRGQVFLETLKFPIKLMVTYHN